MTFRQDLQRLRDIIDFATHKAKQLGQNRVSFKSPSLKRRDRLD
ncbi:MAG: hypothetical protein V9G98_02290 [Candidatus Competibacter sp.]